MAGSKYQEWLTADGLLRIEGWARDGLTLDQIAHNCGCSLSTLCKWKADHSEISEAIKRGKAPVDIQVENALLKRALGYEFTETMVEESEDGTKIRKTVKQIVPDTTAQIFWLRNRRPDKWRNKPEPSEDGELLKKAKELLEGLPDAID